MYGDARRDKTFGHPTHVAAQDVKTAVMNSDDKQLPMYISRMDMH